MTLRLFPARAAIGTAIDKDGRAFSVFSTPEFNRALAELLVRVGGETAISTSDVEVLLSFMAAPNVEANKAIHDLQIESGRDHSAEIAELRKTVEELKAQLSFMADPSAAVAEVKKYAQDMEISYLFAPPPTDWEHPGSIGAKTANAGAFTTVSATGQITSTLATGTAPFVVASTTNVANLNASSLNGATFASPGAIGSTTAGTGRFTSVQVTTGGSTTISTGVGSIRMSTANAATNSAWIPFIYAGTTYYLPAFTTNAP